MRHANPGDLVTLSPGILSRGCPTLGQGHTRFVLHKDIILLVIERRRMAYSCLGNYHQLVLLEPGGRLVVTDEDSVRVVRK